MATPHRLAVRITAVDKSTMKDTYSQWTCRCRDTSGSDTPGSRCDCPDQLHSCLRSGRRTDCDLVAGHSAPYVGRNPATTVTFAELLGQITETNIQLVGQLVALQPSNKRVSSVCQSIALITIRNAISNVVKIKGQ